ncbi:MAG: hypothetical protein ACR2LM_03280, partial [Pyrinomonadaceae bacterium]
PIHDPGSIFFSHPLTFALQFIFANPVEFSHSLYRLVVLTSPGPRPAGIPAISLPSGDIDSPDRLRTDYELRTINTNEN